MTKIKNKVKEPVEQQKEPLLGYLSSEIIDFLNGLRVYKNIYVRIERHEDGKWDHYVIKIIGIDTDLYNIVINKYVMTSCNIEMTMYKTETDEEKLEITLHLF